MTAHPGSTGKPLSGLFSTPSRGKFLPRITKLFDDWIGAVIIIAFRRSFPCQGMGTRCAPNVAIGKAVRSRLGSEDGRRNSSGNVALSREFVPWHQQGINNGLSEAGHSQATLA
jgi:hypothetical protein